MASLQGQVAVLVVNYGIFNTMVLKIPWFTTKTAKCTCHDISWIKYWFFPELCHPLKTKMKTKLGTQSSWWRHQMETFPALLALCEGNPPVTGGFSSQRPVTRSFDVFFALRLNKRLSKQSRRRWFGTPSRSSWRFYNDNIVSVNVHKNCQQEWIIQMLYMSDRNGKPVILREVLYVF